MLNQQSWVTYDEAKCKDSQVEIAVQVNGKIRDKIVIDAESSKEDALNAAKIFRKGSSINGRQTDCKRNLCSR